MEGARGDEKNVVRPDRAVFGLDSASLDDGEEIALHPFTGNVRSLMVGRSRRNFIDFIEKHDSRLFCPCDGFGIKFFRVDDLIALFLGENFEGLGNFHPPGTCLSREHAAEHILDVDSHLFHVHTAQKVNFRALVGNFEFHLPVVEFSLEKHSAEFFTGAAIVFVT